MILNAEQIEEVKYLIMKKQDELAVKKLIEYSGCDPLDAQYVVEEYSGDNNFEELLDKHWIEKREAIDVRSLEKTELSHKEKMSLLKIFLPVVVVIIFTLILIILS